MAATTTIKVTPELRDRINHDAGARGLTAARFLERLLDDYEREQMLSAFGRSFATADDDYRVETARWAELETDLPRD